MANTVNCEFFNCRLQDRCFIVRLVSTLLSVSNNLLILWHAHGINLPGIWGLIFGSLEVYSANTDAVSARARHQNTYSVRSSKWTIPIFAAVAQHPCHRQTEVRLRSEGIGQIHRQQRHPGRDRQPARCLAPTDDKIAGLRPSALANQHDVP